MPTCNRCGEEIEFRYINGRCVPIHPDGGLHCGSWSGSTTDYGYRSDYHYLRQDFTRPTTCPECHAQVYFVRHNGGSVWFDDLGWPWPKHACFDNDVPARQFTHLSAKSSGLSNPSLALIYHAHTDTSQQETVLFLRLNGVMRLSVVTRWYPSRTDLMGALVVVSRDDNLLLHHSYGEIPFYGAVELPPDKEGWTQCPRCETWVNNEDFEGHEQHCRKHHKLSREAKPASATKNAPPVARPWLERLRRRGRQPSEISEAEKQSEKPPATQKPVAARSSHLEPRIEEAIERIRKEAWLNVNTGQPHELQIKDAKQNAIRLIRLLSPHIRRQVEHRFSSQKWSLLLAHKPR
ncbi:MAG TPA: hypothetical protein VFB72_01135 [Verrucomicrobiae bacterium]|nr:hypothetical protein [Verrucomicrobiae bacterium]